ncbi:MAG: single-stranded DNA-binding protein [Clostridia bacterium]|nr:single-stranded DNA-binding protein [Clostridia bacterium]MBR2735603.1 single-stranded DNA-binding protein [Clostridia bacterium]
MLNVVVLTGRLVADPELRHTANDLAVTTFTIAVNRRYTRPGEERQTDFIDIVAWRNSAEFVCKYFQKGSLIAIEGSIQTRTYQDKDGKNRKVFEVVANNVQFAESKRDGGSVSDTRNDFDAAAVNTDSYSSGSDEDFQTTDTDDDLPF